MMSPVYLLCLLVATALADYSPKGYYGGLSSGAGFYDGISSGGSYYGGVSSGAGYYGGLPSGGSYYGGLPSGGGYYGGSISSGVGLSGLTYPTTPLHKGIIFPPPIFKSKLIRVTKPIYPKIPHIPYGGGSVYGAGSVFGAGSGVSGLGGSLGSYQQTAYSGGLGSQSYYPSSGSYNVLGGGLSGHGSYGPSIPYTGGSY